MIAATSTIHTRLKTLHKVSCRENRQKFANLSAEAKNKRVKSLSKTERQIWLPNSEVETRTLGRFRARCLYFRVGWSNLTLRYGNSLYPMKWKEEFNHKKSNLGFFNTFTTELNLSFSVFEVS